jgi:hypothetical protein
MPMISSPPTNSVPCCPFQHFLSNFEILMKPVIEFYNKGGVPNRWLSTQVRPLGLTGAQQADLLAFLEALTGEIDPALTSPPVLPQ